MSARIALISESFASGPQPLIRGPVILRPWADADAAFLAEAFADPDIARWHSHVHATPQDFIARRHREWSEASGGDWAVEDAGSVAGRVALHHLDLGNGSAEIGYWVHPSHRRRGVAGRAVAVATDWAFDAGFHRIQLEHSVQNAASCGVALSCHYEFEGIARSQALHDDGWHDMHIHARINPADANS